jgi:hypothetical protein
LQGVKGVKGVKRVKKVERVKDPGFCRDDRGTIIK